MNYYFISNIFLNFIYKIVFWPIEFGLSITYILENPIFGVMNRRLGSILRDIYNIFELITGIKAILDLIGTVNH